MTTFFSLSLTTPSGYSQSKLANIIYAAELAKRYTNIMTVSVHPGVVETGLVTNLGFMKKAFIYGVKWITRFPLLNLEQGCLSQLWVTAGAERAEMVNGAFYVPISVMSNDQLDKMAKSEKLASELWRWTEEILNQY